jgi:hypothetical protein
VLHVDHQLAEPSQLNAEFVRDLAAGWVFRSACEPLYHPGRNLEQEARNGRLAFFHSN